MHLLSPNQFSALFLVVFGSLVGFGNWSFCQTPGEASAKNYPAPKSSDASAAPTTAPAITNESQAIAAATLAGTYAWLAEEAPASSELSALKVIALDKHFAPPAGYTRVQVDERSMGAFLRQLPVRTDRTDVRSYAGKRLSSPSAAIVAMDVGARNLQQCADTIIRLHAEYLWSSGRQNALGYHFTSGDLTRWRDWANGERFKISGSKVARIRRRSINKSRSNFRTWLDTVFMYAGTRSLRLDSDSVAAKAIQPGDFFVAPGSPGHAVIVLDIAENADGQRVALIGQGFMPAQELHVLRARGPQVLDKVWFKLPGPGEALKTPSWKAFSADQIRRFHLDELPARNGPKRRRSDALRRRLLSHPGRQKWIYLRDSHRRASARLLG